MILFRSGGGDVVLPDQRLVLVSREDGGNLVVNPPRAVWERSELEPKELVAWTFLVAATARAMLNALPQLAEGCVNYWEAGNWALNEAAEPPGLKSGPEHRRVHLHLLGRSRDAQSEAWQWGEAPVFPKFADRHAWAAKHQRLTAEECRQIVAETEHLLITRYGVAQDTISKRVVCAKCGYPTVEWSGEGACAECRAVSP